MKEILRTAGLPVSSAPISAGMPVTMLMTPAGMPARSARTPSASAEKGVSSDGLITTVQPAASAGATLRVIIAFGKFQGVMIAADPDRLLQRHDAAVGRRRGDDRSRRSAAPPRRTI